MEEGGRLEIFSYSIAMANIARHVIANVVYSEDSTTNDNTNDNTSTSDTGRVASSVSDDIREDSPLSSSSGPEHITTTEQVSVRNEGVKWFVHCCVYGVIYLSHLKIMMLIFGFN